MITEIEKKVKVAVYQKGKEGTNCCGDRYFYKETAHGFICALADGLGSGQYAEESAQIVIDTIKDNPFATDEALVNECVSRLWGKRGVVLGILKLDFKTDTYSFSSIGNIGMIKVMNDKKRHRHIPWAGYLAGYKRKLKTTEGKLEYGMNFYMFSDGVTDKELSFSTLNKDVDEAIKTFKCISSESIRMDDTTFIAMGYRKNQG